MNPIGLILLAAGGSRRLGSPKQLLRDADGQSILRRAARTAAASDCHPQVVMLGGAAEESALELEGLPLHIVVNTEWETGMASSLKTGLRALTKTASLDAVVVMLCDQPGVTPTLLNSLIAAFRDTGHKIVACDYGGAVGVPALFGRALFGELLALQGDEGGRRIIKAYSGPSTYITFPAGKWDIDTPEDVEAMALSRAE